MTKSKQGKNAILGLQDLVSSVQDHCQKKLGQELKEGTWKQELTMEEPGFTLFSFFSPQQELLAQGAALTTVGWIIPHQSLMKKMPHRLGYRKFDEGSLSIKFPSFQMALSCIRLTKIK